jgi:ABC-type amino acid transport substrate-binding protein
MIRIGLTEELYPYSKFTKEGQAYGINVDLITLLLLKQKIQESVRFIDVPIVRTEWAIQANAVDGLFLQKSIYATILSDEHMECSQAIYPVEYALYARAKEKWSPLLDWALRNNLEGIPGERVGILRGSLFEELRHRYPEHHFFDVNSSLQLYRLLVTERVDVVITEELSFVYHVRRYGDFAKVRFVDMEDRRNVHFCISRTGKLKKLSIHAVNQSIQELSVSGELGLLFEKYLTISTNQKE